MGAWGTAIFSDDVACDVRANYREMIGESVEGPAATDRILRDYQDSLNDRDDGPVVWLALAATQWKLGRLEDRVKAKALEVIDSGAGLDLWEEQGPKLLQKRQAVLRKLRDELTSPQPPPKKVKLPAPMTTDWKPGDAVSYRHSSGNYVVIRVVGIYASRRNRVAVLELCDWAGRRLPNRRKIERMRAAKFSLGSAFWLIAPRKRDFPADRLELIAEGLKLRGGRRDDASTATSWAGFDKRISEHFRLPVCEEG